MTQRLAALQGELSAKGASAELIDLRTVDLPSIDYDTIGRSLAKTGVLVIVEEAAASQGIGPRLAAEVTCRFFDQLDAPPMCLASLDVPTSVSRVLERAALISDELILERVAGAARRGGH
jgi:2-oxoisovalerate dehydrogenase E1 component